ncbi:PLP-dependent aminotransferase family protein [Actinobacteria bacterium YIM 96077]|uniref:PLP-dependent aminotransferase family protein n=1 Tax=Phytoactinopolyspora halophila TaxID=1981511 RepID=A0A329QZS5_9ACTN|nr:PLP-dependent aminotransferase family protein [Phytoactinopolyspora halophila]AYY11741.1 PLP-dependent aminotransferase family protein [Actinobacteria bacterium YIM 96077]RAW17825.1 PLP-dependent aminotransferase family protein [Phytoactinopolyspora halophila]
MPSDEAVRLAASWGEAPRNGKGAWLRARLIAAIREGWLNAGDTIPGARDLASALDVSRGTVDSVYSQLSAEGFIEQAPRRRPAVMAAPGAGPAVPSMPASAAPPPTPGVPDPSLFPHRAWSAAARTALARLGPDDLGYPDPSGHPHLRLVLAEWLRRTRGVAAEPDDVHVTAGVAHAMALLADVLGAETWALERPGSPGSTHMMRQLVDVRQVPVDASGLVPEAIPPGAGAVLVTPTHQYPTGVLMPADRRRALVETSGAAGRWVIEDDWDSQMAPPSVPSAMQALAPETVILIGSVSKSIAPGIRLGWIVSPPSVAERLKDARQRTDLGVSVFVQLTVAELISSGGLDRHIRRARAEYERRRARLEELVRPYGPLIGLPGAVHAFVQTASPEPVVADMNRRGIPTVVVDDEHHPGVLVSVAACK